MSNRRHTLRTPAFPPTGAAATVVPLTAMTPAAQAKVAPKPLAAKTLLPKRLGSGGNGYWANDNFTRTPTFTYLGKSTGRARGEGEHPTDHLAGGVTGDGIIIRVPVGGPSCQMVWQHPQRVDTEGHEPCTSISRG